MDNKSEDDPAPDDIRWRVFCHEAGHVLYAIRNELSVVFAQVNDNGGGEKELSRDPLSYPGSDWSPHEIENYQRYLAAQS